MFNAKVGIFSQSYMLQSILFQCSVFLDIEMTALLGQWYGHHIVVNRFLRSIMYESSIFIFPHGNASVK